MQRSAYTLPILYTFKRIRIHHDLTRLNID